MTPIKTSEDGTQVEYPTACPFSQNNKYFILLHAQGFIGLYSITGKLIKVLPSEISSSAHPRWSRDIEPIIYYTIGNSLKVINVETNLTNTVHQFDEYKSISEYPYNAESDISRDGNHFVFYASKLDGTKETFVYNMSRNLKELSTNIVDPIDAVRLSPYNKIIISKLDGNYLFDGKEKRLTQRLTHSAPALFEGKEYLLCGSNAIGENKGSVVMKDFETLQESQLIAFSWKYEVHISSCDKDFCLISMSSPTNDLPAQLWTVDYKTKVPKLVYQYSYVFNKDAEPKASLSRDGAYLAFGSFDGAIKTSWLIKLDPSEIKPPAGDPTQLNPETRIDYSKYLDYEFIMRPNLDGSINIFQRKIK